MGHRRMLLILVAIAFLGAGCRLVEGPVEPPAIGSPGTPADPRELNLIARDYVFEPAELRLVPGETVLLHVVNAGLDLHEAVIGGPDVQAAWEAAEMITSGAPPGATPAVSVPPELAGLRVLVGSGQRVDVTYVVPARSDSGLTVGCHIPGHYARGMVAPVRLVAAESGS
jgi:uncharacterized cupredoxin-like copper-binding protein